MDFFKSLWTPVTQDETELCVEKLTKPVSRTQWEQCGQQNIPETYSNITRKCTPPEAKSDPVDEQDQSSHKRKPSSHPNLSDSDSSTEDCEFANDLVRAGKRNVNQKRDSWLSSSSYTNDDTANSTQSSTRVSLTLEDIGDGEAKITFSMETKVVHSDEDGIIKTENPDDVVRSRDHAHEDQGVEFSSHIITVDGDAVQKNDRAHEDQDVEFPSHIITVDDKLHADFGQMFTRNKTRSARYDIIDNNPQYEQYGRIINERRHSLGYNKQTTTITREVSITLQYVLIDSVTKI